MIEGQSLSSLDRRAAGELGGNQEMAHDRKVPEDEDCICDLWKHRGMLATCSKSDRCGLGKNCSIGKRIPP